MPQGGNGTVLRTSLNPEFARVVQPRIPKIHLETRHLDVPAEVEGHLVAGRLWLAGLPLRVERAVGQGGHAGAVDAGLDAGDR